jgi:hypothetical protein
MLKPPYSKIRFLPHENYVSIINICAASENNHCLFWVSHKTHKYTYIVGGKVQSSFNLKTDGIYRASHYYVIFYRMVSGHQTKQEKSSENVYLQGE